MAAIDETVTELRRIAKERSLVSVSLTVYANGAWKIEGSNGAGYDQNITGGNCRPPSEILKDALK